MSTARKGFVSTCQKDLGNGEKVCEDTLGKVDFSKQKKRYAKKRITQRIMSSISRPAG